MDLAQRRLVGGAIRVGLIVVAIAIFASWMSHRVISRAGNVRVQREPVAVETLGPGDMRIFNSDSSVDLILRGREVLAGLSPKTVDRIRGRMEQSSTRDTSGLGG